MIQVPILTLVTYIMCLQLTLSVSKVNYQLRGVERVYIVFTFHAVDVEVLASKNSHLFWFFGSANDIIVLAFIYLLLFGDN